MGRNSHRKKERHEQRRKEKRKRQAQARARQEGVGFRAPAITGSNAPHRHRISQQAPSAWPGELAEDVAIFDDAALGPLSPELAAQATAVRAALRDALERRGEEGLQRVSSIPRESPFSEWRLFLRGLVEWLEECPDAASDAWKRLNPERRPGRIATVMLLAARADLENATPSADEPCPAQIGSAQAAGSVQVAGTRARAWRGSVWRGVARNGAARPGTAWEGTGKRGPVGAGGTVRYRSRIWPGSV
jgi:hypothetical protein